MLATEGWLIQSDVSAIQLAGRLAEMRVETVVFTDIRRDGTLAGPNLDALREMTRLTEIAVIASGGVGTIEDVSAIAETGAAGAIIGRALYDGRVDLPAAISLAGQTV
jgi:phosphoribosylformimino-5-aminoimidazole carboxamide ribotide isomerase